MPEPPVDPPDSASDHAPFQELPRFRASDEDPPPPGLPSRMKTWGLHGALGGAACGALIGTLILVLQGSSSVLEALSMFFSPSLVLALAGGIYFWLRGAIADTVMEADDQKQQREAEDEAATDRDWKAVQEIMKKKKPQL